MRASASSQTARMLQTTTTLVFVLLGIGCYLGAEVIGSGAPMTILQGIGGFLIGTVVVSYAYQHFLGEETENRTVAKLDEVLALRIDDFFPGAIRYGFSGFATEAPPTVFSDLEADDELLWLDTYSPDLKSFLPDLCKAVRRGAHLRMLVIDPGAETAQLRAAEIVRVGYEAATFRNDTAAFSALLAEAESDLEGAAGSLEVRWYSDLPCVPMYLRLRQGMAITGITGYFLSEPSFDTVHLRWSGTPNGMLPGFHGYFEQKWAQAARP